MSTNVEESFLKFVLKSIVKSVANEKARPIDCVVKLDVLYISINLFVWNDKIEQADEFLIFMKSQMILFEELSERVKALHSYEVPEVLALPIVGGSKAYLDWLGASLK